jgi:hypothetical protein
MAESPTKKDPNRKTVSLHNLQTGKRLTQTRRLQTLSLLPSILGG